MSVPDEIAKPACRALWKAAKKSAAEKAKQLKIGPGYAKLDDQFDLDLGPELDKWPKLYPNFRGMQAQKVKIEGIIEKYDGFVKRAKGLDKQVTKPVKDGLKTLRETLDSREKEAELLISTDVSLGLKKSQEKPLTAIMLLKHSDISGAVMKLAPQAKAVLPLTAMPLEILLDDESILKKIGAADENPNVAEKVRDEANLAKVVREIAAVYDRLGAAVRQDPKKFGAAQNLLEKAVEKACQNAIDRGAAELVRATKVRTAYRNYKIKTTVNLTLAVTGTVAGAVSLGLAPFTGGASMIVSAVGVAKGAVEVGRQLADLASSAEEIAAELKRDIRKLLKRYRDVQKGDVGVAELGVTLLNAVSPTFFVTISDCDSKCGLVGDKINGLEVKADDTSKKLDQVLDVQVKVTQGLRAWEQEAKALLTPEEARAIDKMFKQLDDNAAEVSALIEKVIQLNQRVAKARADHKVLATDLKTLSSKEPTWAKVGEVLINTSANVGFLVSANVGWPDAYKIAETTKAIVDTVGNVAGSLGGAKDLIEDAKDLIEEAASG